MVYSMAELEAHHACLVRMNWTEGELATALQGLLPLLKGGVGSGAEVCFIDVDKYQDFEGVGVGEYKLGAFLPVLHPAGCTADELQAFAQWLGRPSQCQSDAHNRAINCTYAVTAPCQKPV